MEYMTAGSDINRDKLADDIPVLAPPTVDHSVKIATRDVDTDTIRSKRDSVHELIAGASAPKPFSLGADRSDTEVPADHGRLFMIQMDREYVQGRIALRQKELSAYDVEEADIMRRLENLGWKPSDMYAMLREDK